MAVRLSYTLETAGWRRGGQNWSLQLNKKLMMVNPSPWTVSLPCNNWIRLSFAVKHHSVWPEQMNRWCSSSKTCSLHEQQNSFPCWSQNNSTFPIGKKLWPISVSVHCWDWVNLVHTSRQSKCSPNQPREVFILVWRLTEAMASHILICLGQLCGRRQKVSGTNVFAKKSNQPTKRFEVERKLFDWIS